MNYKNLVLGLVLIGLVIPLASFAATTPLKQKMGKVGDNFCVNLTTRLDAQSKKLAERLTNFEVKKAEQLKKISENRLTRDEKRLTIRAKVDENRDTRLTQLEARASTTEQKTAVATFRSTLKTLAETRRLVVDEAIKAYRTSVDGALATRKTSVETARIALQTTTNGLIEKAKADCASGADTQTIRTNLNAGIKTAREQFATTIKGLDKVRELVTVAATTRKEAVTKAQNDFKIAYEKALVELKAAF